MIWDLHGVEVGVGSNTNTTKPLSSLNSVLKVRCSNLVCPILGVWGVHGTNNGKHQHNVFEHVEESRGRTHAKTLQRAHSK